MSTESNGFRYLRMVASLLLASVMIVGDGICWSFTLAPTWPQGWVDEGGGLWPSLASHLCWRSGTCIGWRICRNNLTCLRKAHSVEAASLPCALTGRLPLRKAMDHVELTVIFGMIIALTDAFGRS